MSVILLNHQWIPREKASISIDDRGFRFGDGVFETILVWDGIPYLWYAHLQRLQAGLDALNIKIDTEKLESYAKELVARNDLENGVLRIIITRGPGSKGYLPSPDIHGKNPTLYMEIMPMPEVADDNKEASLCIASYRKPSPAALPVRYKLTQSINSILARIEAEEQGCTDAIILTEHGHLCETSSSNLFWCKRKTLYTPALSTGCLAGTIRQRLIETSPFRVKTGHFKLKHLLKADGIFVTNSVHLVVPISKLRGYERTWPASARLAKMYQMHLEKDMVATQPEKEA